MPKSKKEMMNRNYAERRAAGLKRMYFWVPEELSMAVKEAVERVLAKKKRFWG